MEGSIVSRRHAFKIAGLAGAAAALSGRSSFAQTTAAAPASLPQGSGFYRTHVGDAEVTVVSDGGLPFSPPFPTFGANAGEDAVNTLLRENFIDPANVVGQINALLVRVAAGPYVLVDTGAGRSFGPASGFLRQNLAAAGVPADAIRHVVFTHLHPDHVGGSLDADKKPVFRNATHHVHRIERDFWASGSPDFSKSGVPADMRPVLAGAAKTLIDALGDSLKTFDGREAEPVPGLTALLAPGHTPGHCAVALERPSAESFVYIADAAHHPVISFQRPEWHVAFDTDLDAAVATRKGLYAKLAKDRTLVAGPHLPFPSLGHLRARDAAFEWVPVPWRWA